MLNNIISMDISIRILIFYLFNAKARISAAISAVKQYSK